jgi:hypothetical protein
VGVRNEESQARERALLSAGVCSCTGTLASGTNGFFFISLLPTPAGRSILDRKLPSPST